MTPHVPPRFREDNTEGYTAAQLRELNRRFDDAVTDQRASAPSTMEELTYKSWTDHIAETVEREFDREHTNRLEQWLPRRIQIIQGHDILADEPDWTGTISDFLEANPEMTVDEILVMIADFERRYDHRIGGGATGCFTVRLATS